MRSQAYIGLGSNLGDSRKTLLDGLQHLHRSGLVQVKACSGLYRTSPMLLTEQPDFINMAALIATDLSPSGLLGLLLETEQQFGRVRYQQWGPRTLDLDLLFHDDRIESRPGLEIPHPGIACRGFVLVPLAEIAADFVHPGLGRTVNELLRNWLGSPAAAQASVIRIGDCLLRFTTG